MPAKQPKKVQDTKEEQLIEVCLPASKLAEIMNIPPDQLSTLRLAKIMREFAMGFDFLKGYKKTATIFGASRFDEDHPSSKEAYKLASQLAEEKFAVITGGGPGIMAAANKGAFDAGGQSAGINIELPKGQRSNEYVTESVSFHYFFARKVMLAFASEVYIFFPGGFGTLDEFFEMTMLVQTKKIAQIPIVLVGKEFWQPLLDWMEHTMYEKYRAVEREHLNLYMLFDNADEAFEYIKTNVTEDRLRR